MDILNILYYEIKPIQQNDRDGDIMSKHQQTEERDRVDDGRG